MQEITDPWQRQDKEIVDANPQENEIPEQKEKSYIRFWRQLRRLGLGDSALRLGTAITTILLAFLVVWVIDKIYLEGQSPRNPEALIALAEAESTTSETLTEPLFKAGGSNADGIDRTANLHTTLPTKNARDQVIQYTIEAGDSIFSIAEKFDLKPETILWGNRYTLGDDPHFILPGQTLNILPVDGVYHQWSVGEGLNGIAAYYNVTPEVIINWPGNDLDEEEIGDLAFPNIPAETMLVIPGGIGTYTDWRTPRITREEPATAKHLGPGACTGNYDGMTGTLSFIWPTTERYLSGFDFSPETNHFGIDIAGNLGNAIYSADTGVVVYAGWNDYGYGEMVVIDHGFGWQTLYAHLNQVNVACGEEVLKGEVIGLMGSTGKSTGPHLHFEMRNDEYGRVNPWNFLE